jgi:ferredoxin
VALAPPLGALGLNVLLPLSSAAFDAAAAPLGLADLLAGAAGALIVGSGGPMFFDLFERAPEAADGAPNPLDRYTARVVARATQEALDPRAIVHAVGFPFDARPLIPFQRIGRAAGLGGPGPLGLQIHPRFGPWWAYRALIVLDRPLPPAPPPGDGCAGCDAPCVAACPAGAVRRGGFDVAACQGRRLVAEPCRLSCDARIACVRGPEHRYREVELAFHMRASIPRQAPTPGGIPTP